MRYFKNQIVDDRSKHRVSLFELFYFCGLKLIFLILKLPLTQQLKKYNT